MKAWKLVPFALLLAATSGCEMARHDRSSDTYLDPEASSFQIIDIAVAEPVVDALDAPMLNSYQPYWALRADLLARLGRVEAARAAYDEAIARERDGAVIRFLSERRAGLG